MKMLTVSLLVCAMMALTRSAAVTEAEPGEKTGPPNQEAVPEAEPYEKTGPPNQEGESQLVKTSLPCPSGWAGFSGRCFLYVPTPMTWANAEKHCQVHGGNLASVHSFTEHFFIKTMILFGTFHFPTTWLGGSDAQQEGTWFWKDGSPFRFNYWAPGQPDNRENAHCLVMNYGFFKKYDNQPCSRAMPFVCANNPCLP